MNFLFRHAATIAGPVLRPALRLALRLALRPPFHPSFGRAAVASCLFAAALAPGLTVAQDLGSEGSGGAGMPGIALVPAARPAGLAGAYTAHGDGSSALGINPAGLAREEGTVYSGAVRSAPALANTGAVSWAFPALGGRWAVGAAYMDYGGVLLIDENAVSRGTARPYSLYPSATYARAHGDRWRWGATFKLAHETLGEFEGSRPAFGAAFDAGVQYQPTRRNLSLGLSLTNAGRQLTGYFEGDERRASLPGALRAGIAYQPVRRRRLTLVADVERPFHAPLVVTAGGEYRMLPEWTVRAGTRWNRDDLNALRGLLEPDEDRVDRGGEALKLAGGTTVRIGPVAVDYAAQWRRELGIVHALSLAWTSRPRPE